MLKYLSKFAMEILPSVVATIIGAYIVNHYIVAKPADAPVAAAISPVAPKAAQADTSNLPEPGVRAKGILEKTVLDRSASQTDERAAEQNSEKTAVKPAADKPSDRPTDTANIAPNIAPEARRHVPTLREKVANRPAAPQAATAAATPAAASSPTPVASTPVDTLNAGDDRRDANDLARAAIERLRAEQPSRGPDAARAAELSKDASREAPRVVEAPRALPTTGPVRPLPPPIMVSSPAAEPFDPATMATSTAPSTTGSARIGDAQRLVPPADIPPPASSPAVASRPLDLRAEAATDPSNREHQTVAEDVLSAAKSVFHAVLPK